MVNNIKNIVIFFDFKKTTIKILKTCCKAVTDHHTSQYEIYMNLLQQTFATLLFRE